VDDRRAFLTNLSIGLAGTLAVPGLSSGAPSTEVLVRPKALRTGDTVGLITPATYVPDPDRIALAEQTLKYFGLRMKLGKNAGKRMGDYRISIEERLDDLHAMFRDRDVDAVFAIRGGYGSMHILDRIDYDLIRRNPKVFLGYSDITAMHLAINRHAKLLTFHGPITLSRFTDYTQKYFRKALFENQPIGAVTNPPESNELRPSHHLRTIRPGTATGPLTGGNLTLISNTMGTPYEIETRGKVLFLEDVDEEPYSIDRMLTHLRLAGKFDDVAGVIFGECQDCRPRDYKPSSTIPYGLGEVLDNILGGLKVPVLYGLTIGHTDDQLTLPLGVAATLDATRGTLEIKEAAVL
jgi:muramoyltetrapeptide carboxypeptidase